MKERWKVCRENDIYEVSDLGRVRRAKPGIRTWVGRILKAAIGSHGYWVVVLYDKAGEPTQFLVHRLVASNFIGPCPLGKEVNHKDAVKTHCMLKNLEYVTSKGNSEHAMSCCIVHAGERHYRTALTWKMVCEIRKLRASGQTGNSLAKRFSISPQSVCDIVKYRTWKVAA